MEMQNLLNIHNIHIDITMEKCSESSGSFARNVMDPQVDPEQVENES